MEQEVVSGIAFSKDEAKITLLRVQDKPGVAAQVFTTLADAGVNVDMIVQNISPDGKTTDITFTLPRTDLPRALQTLENAKIECDEIRTDANVAKLSIVGIGMKSHAGVANKMFKALAEKSINIQVISTSEIKVSVLIQQDYLELAVRALHSAFGLEKAGKK